MAIVDGQLYVLGGNKTGRPLTTCERYVALRGCWESLPRMVTVRNACSAAAVGGLLYAANRKVGKLQCPATCERFDPSLDKWQVLPLSSTPYDNCILATVADQLYIILERAGGHVVERLERSTGRWESIPGKVTGVEYQLWGASGNNTGLYVVGRCAGSLLVEVFSRQAGAWEVIRPPLPAILAPLPPAGAVTATAGWLYIFCAETKDEQPWSGPEEPANAGYCFNIESRTLQRWGSLPTFRTDYAMVAVSL